MIKVKTKADRVAARAAHRESKGSTSVMTAPAIVTPPNDIPIPAEETSMEIDNTPADHHANESEEAASAPQTTVKDPVPDRIELLRSKHEVVSRFMKLTVPVLIDVYAASVVTPVRLKTLTGLLKAVGFLEGEDLKRVLTVSHSPIFLLVAFSDLRVAVCSRGQLLILCFVLQRPSYACSGCSAAGGDSPLQGPIRLHPRLPSRGCVP